MQIPDPTSFITAFSRFLRWLRTNLNGQTPIRVDAAWASQSFRSGRLYPDIPARPRDPRTRPRLSWTTARLRGIPFPALAADRASPADLAPILTQLSNWRARLTRATC